VPHHVLSDKHLVKYLAVVYQKGKAYELRDDGTSSCPGFYWLPGTRTHLPADFSEQFLVNVGPFFKRSSHIPCLDFLTWCPPPCITYDTHCYKVNWPCLLLLRLLIILLLLGFRGFLVFPPFAKRPVGEHGWRPPFDRPSPPPMGWATGFIALPLT